MDNLNINSFNHLNLLIVDDEPDILDLIADEFKYLGFQVFKAKCGQDAIKLLEEKTIHIVISDFKMPNGNGLSVLNYSLQLLPPPFFAFISGQADLTIDECLKAGANLYYSKPFEIDHLIQEIVEIFKQV